MGSFEGQAQTEPQMVEFSVQVVVSERQKQSGKGEISVPIISVIKAKVGGEINSKNESITTQNLKFSVPVYFQAKNPGILE